MKRLVEFLKLLLYFVVGFLIFSGIVSLIEFVLLSILSNMEPNYIEILIKNARESFKTYVVVYLVIFALNLVYNIISVKLLNDKLNKVKKEGDKYEK